MRPSSPVSASSATRTDLRRVTTLEAASIYAVRPLAAAGLGLVFLALAGIAAAIAVGTAPEDMLIITATVFAAYMALNIGANDVANNMGPAVGAKALTMGGAIAIAAIFESAGALIGGKEVITTVSTGIIDPPGYSERAMHVRALMAAVLGAALWLNLATWIGAPISTTHAVLGALIGAGIAAGMERGQDMPVRGREQAAAAADRLGQQAEGPGPGRGERQRRLRGQTGRVDGAAIAGREPLVAEADRCGRIDVAVVIRDIDRAAAGQEPAAPAHRLERDGMGLSALRRHDLSPLQSLGRGQRDAPAIPGAAIGADRGQVRAERQAGRGVVILRVLLVGRRAVGQHGVVAAGAAAAAHRLRKASRHGGGPLRGRGPSPDPRRRARVRSPSAGPVGPRRCRRPAEEARQRDGTGGRESPRSGLSVGPGRSVARLLRRRPDLPVADKVMPPIMARVTEQQRFGVVHG